ncbi:hypothetical protein BGW39_005573 [Mortierella sp. 14UC]|nr:hypothetical protein BGW39_005573 [Mortierella sp. 14UC]
MKFTQPLFLLTLSIASALTLFAESAPSSSTSSLNKRSISVPATAALASKRHPQQRRQLQQKRGGLSSPPPPIEAVTTRAPTTTNNNSKGKKSSSSSSATRRRLDKSAVSAASKIDGRSISSTSSSATNSQQLRRRRNHKNSDDENRVSAAAATTIQKKKRRARLSSSGTPPSPPPPSFRKRAAAVDPPSASSSNSRTARTPARRLSSATTTPKKNTPLLLLPDSRSVWQTGTYQTVRWNRKYTKKLPADTTVDIVLIDSKTNRKVSSLKRFVPFRKGGSQVWVPTDIPEGTSFVLVLELYRGRSQEQVTSASPSASANGSAQDVADAGSSPYRHRESSNTSSTRSSSSSGSNGGGSMSSSQQQQQQPTTTDVLSRIVRRSDINIAAGTKKRDISNYPPGSSDPNSNGNNDNNNNGRVAKPTGAHRDINHDDFYAGPSQERSMEFLPDELRQEYPNTVRPLILEHTFGLHQKVYTLTPYTLEWKIPERVTELLEYTRKAQELFNTYAKATSASPQARARARALLPKSTFLSKVLVEIIKDQNMESVSVLAKDVPTETMFQYLSIQDRLPPAFYRLRVQMVVVQVQTDVNALPTSPPTASSVASKATMEGWEFPEGGKVIDRYEAITRRFWVSQGAL